MWNVKKKKYKIIRTIIRLCVDYGNDGKQYWRFYFFFFFKCVMPIFFSLMNHNWMYVCQCSKRLNYTQYCIRFQFYNDLLLMFSSEDGNKRKKKKSKIIMQFHHHLVSINNKRRHTNWHFRHSSTIFFWFLYGKNFRFQIACFNYTSKVNRIA